MTADIEKVKGTIRKLLNLANDDGAAKGEVENAMRFAARLMEQHQLSDDDLSEVDDVLLDLERKECSRETAYTGGQKMSQWEVSVARFSSQLVGGVKFYCDGPSMVRTNGIAQLDDNGSPLVRCCIKFYGIAEDVEIARQVFAEAIVTIASMARLKWGGVYRGPGRCYCEGFADSLLQKLSTDKRAIQSQSSGTALVAIQNRNLVVARKGELAESFLKNQGVKLVNRGQSSNRSYDGQAYGEGRSDGRNHNAAADRRAKLTAK